MDPTEPVSKFSFSHLALVKCENDHEMLSSSSLKTNLSFLLPNNNIHKLTVDNNDISLRDALELLLQKSGWGKGFITSNPCQLYHFEKFGDPSVQFLDLSITVADSKCKDFCLVRNGAKSVQVASAQADGGAG